MNLGLRAKKQNDDDSNNNNNRKEGRKEEEEEEEYDDDDDDKQQQRQQETVAAPGRQGSQVISRSLRSWARSSNTFIFCSHYYRSKAIGRAQLERWLLQPGHLTWRALV